MYDKSLRNNPGLSKTHSDLPFIPSENPIDKLILFIKFNTDKDHSSTLIILMGAYTTNDILNLFYKLNCI